MDTDPDPGLSTEQRLRIELLTTTEIALIDSVLLAECNSNWQKVAKIVGSTLIKNEGQLPNIPDVYLASKLYSWIDSELLDVQGYIGRMRYCEVRLKKH